MDESLEQKIGQPLIRERTSTSLRRRLKRHTFPLLASLIGLSACGGNSPTESEGERPEQTQPFSPQYQATATTDINGIANVSLPSQDVTIKITEKGTNQPLANIAVGTQDYGNLARIVMVDPAEENEYASAVINIYPPNPSAARKVVSF